jgi:hypothetical protein
MGVEASDFETILNQPKDIEIVRIDDSAFTLLTIFK